MTGLISQIAASAVPPSMIPKVGKADALNLKQENHIRAYIRGMTQARIIDRDAGRRMKYKIYFFRMTKMVEETDNPITGGKVRKFDGIMQSNKAAPNQPPQFEDYKETSRIFDFWNVIPKSDREGTYQCFWFSEANCWLPIPTCEKEDPSSEACILLPCSNFWGIKSGEGYNVYDHSGTFIANITNFLDWTECEIEDGDVVEIDTDENCTPKITPDPCAMIKRLCGSSSSSDDPGQQTDNSAVA
jgi:hypothetical protein